MFRALLISIHSECNQLASSATSTPCWVSISIWKPLCCQARYYFRKLNQFRTSVLNEGLKQREKITSLEMVAKIQVSLWLWSWTKTDSSYVLQKLLPQRNWFLKKCLEKHRRKNQIFFLWEVIWVWKLGSMIFIFPAGCLGNFLLQIREAVLLSEHLWAVGFVLKFLPTQSWDKLLKLSVSVENPETFRAFLNRGL